ncbi:MAG: hypothetical protein J6K29_10380 [Clostridia bacterium]|nr:hypothetical protein [Clostridia bacterium]
MMDTNTRAERFVVALDLQIFAESDSSGSSGAESGTAEGVNTDTANSGAAPSEPSAEKSGGVDIASIKREHNLMSFEDARGRFAKDIRQSKAWEAEASLRKALGQRYGVDPDDIAAIEAAVKADKSYIKEFARTNGTSDELAEKHLRYKADSEARVREETERQTAAQNEMIAQEEAKVKALYPDFDMAEAMKSNRFKAMMDSGMTMQEAYEAMNYRRLTDQAVEKAVREAEDRLSKAPATNRPTESASVGGGSENTAGINFDLMSDEELEDWLDKHNH